MRVTIPVDETQANSHLPEVKPDGSGVGINYADQILKNFKLTLTDGRKMMAKRRGLKITLTIGDKQGEAIMRRMENGPDVKNIFRTALEEAAQNAGATIFIEPNQIHLEV
ncbi:MAG: hypothetical protein L0287_14225 [Anaerolineae bacterium]|nr:hypothetical protein [Anaerolineae bacterium]